MVYLDYIHYTGTIVPVKSSSLRYETASRAFVDGVRGPDKKFFPRNNCKLANMGSISLFPYVQSAPRERSPATQNIMTHPDPGQQAFEDGMRWETGVARWRFDGTPVPHAQDPAKALAHYQRSADAQNADGMAGLGRLLHLWGRGGPDGRRGDGRGGGSLPLAVHAEQRQRVRSGVQRLRPTRGRDHDAAEQSRRDTVGSPFLRNLLINYLNHEN